MQNIKFITLLIFVLLTTLYIIAVKPEMHKQAIITDSNYEFVEIGTPNSELPLSNQNIAVSPVSNETAKIDVKNVSDKNISQQTVKSNVTYEKPQKQIKQAEPKKVAKTIEQKPKEQKRNVTPKHEKPVKIEAPRTVEIEQKQNISQPIKPILTEQEEIIAWNRWRSRLQNQVMMDSKIYAPLGTVFKFSFTADKYGNMSNVKVWSTNPSYSNYAVKVIKPVLMSYRNKPILNFPEGTKRIIVNVDGGFTISTTSRYSSPSDYHDYEKVKR